MTLMRLITPWVMGAWRFLEDMQHAIDAVAYEQTVFLRFDMDIGAVVVDGLVDEQTYEAWPTGGSVFAVVLFKVDFFFSRSRRSRAIVRSTPHWRAGTG